ncbi:MAG: SBBP repeat-containing protein, partial [candidate division WOR-3 bacterium]
MKPLNLWFKVLAVLTILFPAVVSAQLVDTVWANRWTSPADGSDWAYAIALDDSGNVYVTGKTENPGTNDDWTTIKYYPDGDTAWVRNFSTGSPNERANALAIGPSGNIYITGYTMSPANGNYLTIKYRPDGDTAWTRIYNGTGDGYDFARWIAVDDQENVYVTGYSRTLTSYPSDIVTIKYDSSGTQLWVAELDGPGNAGDQGNKVITDNNGYVYVIGYVNPYSSLNFYDYATIKYDAVTGDTMWVRTYNGPADGYDVARDIAVDASGNVYVTGSSNYPGTSSDMVTIKYDSTGFQEWVARYDNPDTSGADGGYGVRVDGAGNIYVAGQSRGLGTGTDFVTIKYSPDSTQQWVMRYNGPANGLDRPSDEVGGKCMAIDQSANIYVTGVTWNDTTYNDYITIMYDSAGVEQWVVGYNGYDTLDYSLAIAINDSGDVCVTGRSLGLTTYYDWATVKYHSTVGVAENKRIAADHPWLEIYPNPFKTA